MNKIKQHYREQLSKFLRALKVSTMPTRVGPFKMWVNLADPALGKYFFIHQEYEPFETALIRSVAQPGMIALDIGANIGYYTLHLASCVGTRGQVVAFEPDPENFKLLERNVRANRLTNVHCVHAAVLAFDGETSLYRSNANSGDHRVFDAHDDAVFNYGIRRTAIRVPAISIDPFLAREKKSAALIKIDVQGAEMLALPGMYNTLANPNLILFCEFWPHGLRQANTDPRAFLDALTQIGLQLYEIDEEKRQVRSVDSAELLTRVTDFAYTNLIGAHPSRCSNLPFAISN